MERWEEQKIIQRKEFTNRKVSIPGFNLMLVFLILPILWAKLTPIRDNSDSAPPCTDSNTFKWCHIDKRTKVPK